MSVGKFTKLEEGRLVNLGDDARGGKLDTYP